MSDRARAVASLLTWPSASGTKASHKLMTNWLTSLLHDSGIVSWRSTRETFTAEIAAMVRQLLGSSHARRQIASVGFPGDCCRLASRV